MNVKNLISNQIILPLKEEYYINYLKFLFPFENNVLKLSTLNDIGNLIYSNVCFSEFPKKTQIKKHVIEIELPVLSNGYFEKRFISFDVYSINRINKFISIIFNIDLENYKLDNLDSYINDRQELFYSFLEERDLLSCDGISIDSLLKKDYRNRQKRKFKSNQIR